MQAYDGEITVVLLATVIPALIVLFVIALLCHRRRQDRLRSERLQLCKIEQHRHTLAREMQPIPVVPSRFASPQRAFPVSNRIAHGKTVTDAEAGSSLTRAATLCEQFHFDQCDSRRFTGENEHIPSLHDFARSKTSPLTTPHHATAPPARSGSDSRAIEGSRVPSAPPPPFFFHIPSTWSAHKRPSTSTSISTRSTSGPANMHELRAACKKWDAQSPEMHTIPDLGYACPAVVATPSVDDKYKSLREAFEKQSSRGSSRVPSPSAPPDSGSSELAAHDGELCYDSDMSYSPSLTSTPSRFGMIYANVDKRLQVV